MSKSNHPSPIGYAIGAVGLLAAGGFWFFGMNRNSPANSPANFPEREAIDVPAATVAFPPPEVVAPDTKIRIDGSTSMVTTTQNLKIGFEQKFANAVVTTQAQGSDIGLKLLQTGLVDIAAVSRPLTPAEVAQGLKAVTIGSDPVAIVVGLGNRFSGSLTPAQVVGIFRGTITDWSAVGGTSGKIRVINRPAFSGTRQVFTDLVLTGESFGNTAQFITLDRDATTPLLRALESDGIGYATYAQVMNQKTVRVVNLNQVAPSDPSYPYGRSLLYVYKAPPSPAVKAFLGYALSTTGQQAVFSEN
jgi:phosphate transport system substrate-binding protein